MEERINLNDLEIEWLVQPTLQEDALFLDDAIKQANPVMQNLDLSRTSLIKEDLETLTEDKSKLSEQEYAKLVGAYVKDNFQKNRKRTSVGAVSNYELQRYNDPNIKFNPNADMEEMYASMHPATFSKAVAKAFYTGKATLLYGLNNTVENIKRLASGELPSLFGNEEAKAMADAFLKAELDNPLYYSKEDGELKKFALDATAASGSVVSSIIDGLASSAAVTLAGSALGSPELGLVGLASKIKTGVQFQKAIKAMKTASQQLTNARQLKGISQLGRTALTTHLTITGEAALQAELNKRDFTEKALDEYYKKNGHHASGDALEEINKTASELENSTYAMNMMLVGASTLMQFPALMKGQVTNTFSNKSLYKIVNGKAVPRSIKGVVAREFFTDALAEGGEEYFQGVIDNATQSYFKKQLDGDNRSYVEEMLKATLNPKEGMLREFLIGAFLGGGTSIIKNIPASLQAKKDKSSVIDAFNTNTEHVINYLKTEVDTNKKLSNTDNPIEVNNIIDEKVANIAKTSYRLGTYENRRDYLESLKDINVEEFKSEMGIDVSEVEKNAIIDNMLEQFDFTVQTLRDVDIVFNVNPLNEKWITRAYNDLANKTTGTKIGLSNKIFTTFKGIYVDSILKNKTLGKRLDELEKEISLHTTIDGTDILVAIPNLFSTVLSNPANLKQSVNTFVKQLKESSQLPSTIKDGEILFSASTKKLIEKLDKLDNDNIYAKLATILQHYNVSQDSAEKIRDYISVYNSKKLFENEIAGFNTPKEQRKIFNEIKQYLEYVTEELDKQTVKTKQSPTSTPSTPSKPEQTKPKVEAVKKTEDVEKPEEIIKTEEKVQKKKEEKVTKETMKETTKKTENALEDQAFISDMIQKGEAESLESLLNQLEISNKNKC